ncbi:type IV conjugative transfer system coupling protein TraD [Escherichia coli]|nr:type IV conjugative transfer system coupling protein TraD [Escherichia coli]
MSFNAKDMTQGGQIASMRIRMFSQIANIMLYCLFIFFWILVGLVLWVKISWQTFVNGCIYWWCTTLEGMRDLIKSQPVYEIQYYGKTFRMNAAQVLHDKYMIWCGEQLWSAFVLATVVALVICLITFFVVSWILGRQGKQQSENEVTGGRQLTDNPKDVARMLKKDGKDSDIRIGDLPIIRDSEIQNFCLHGTVGAGKSEVIRRLANYARQRGDMVVIYDRSGEFVKSYYDPSIDKILNPLDARCAAWDLWKECLTQPDFDNTANTLIPMGTKEDPFWQGSGRTIFAEAAYLMRNDPNRSYSKLVDTLLSIKIEKLRTFLRNSPAANLVEEKIEKTAISIRAVLTNYVKAIRYLQGIEHNGESFTIRDWMRGVREDQKNGWLFISSNADTHASLKPVISMWLSIAMNRGYEGAAVGAALGAGITGYNSSSAGATLGVGLAAGLVGMAADAMVEDVNYTMITDVQIAERTKATVTTDNVAALRQGTSGAKIQTSTETGNQHKYQTRVVSNANKVNLKFEEAKPVLEDQLAKSIANIL